ncbi:hypothetical protein BD780_000570 [Clostridium tetanomorphum]|uniref:hypothetical protein n=1 Tax=Clostridium tetanomorphum TaxID=1553 RepID=UPI00044FF337|nr:hypothetical protein [Clostridium tetanomorphum]KAJ51821.1 hypothetical protein CTM_11163 [Clostridium tetanomorphum DSM 665]MBP1865057.1 hypothetical protein [Clostridium tetanomorphum]NRS83345.1 hypothetical protein [Clostridium tetanomorphum]SQC01405.1 dipeptidyl peptidase IV [Clostridium tetanomorphum]
MKNFKRIFAWVVLSLIIQLIGFYYVDKYYLSTDTAVKVKKIEKKNDKKPEAEVKIPENATRVNLSFDGKYVAYYDEDKLKVVNTKDGDVKDISFEDGVKVSYYKWLSDRNRMLIGEKHNNENGHGFKLSYYDVDKDAKEEIKDLTWADENSEVEDIQASTLTNVIYVKVARSGGRSSLYWINIMKEMKRIYPNAYLIGETAILNHEDKLLYEDATYNKIFATNREESIRITDVTKPRLLGVDIDDNVYIGSMENDKITKVYYGTLDKPTRDWNVIPFMEPVDKDDVYISEEGKVLVNDNLKGIVKEVATGKETSYSGKFIQVYSSGVASIKDGKLVKTNFK